ncbi:hypothetical protein, partial [Kitasatospora sp. NPDC059462]|uniref:hypothetical protein n=1 Tax=Kitasatospora sp. NPDC059462 TaxID=3346841 RepID=UPI0036AF2728
MKCGVATYGGGEPAVRTWADGSMRATPAEVLAGATVTVGSLSGRTREVRGPAVVRASWDAGARRASGERRPLDARRAVEARVCLLDPCRVRDAWARTSPR